MDNNLTPLGEMDDTKANNFVVGLMMPKMKKVAQKATKRWFWDITNHRKTYNISAVLGEWLDLPEQAKLKEAISKTKYKEKPAAYWDGGSDQSRDLRYSTLANKFSNAIH